MTPPSPYADKIHTGEQDTPDKTPNPSQQARQEANQDDLDFKGAQKSLDLACLELALLFFNVCWKVAGMQYGHMSSLYNDDQNFHDVSHNMHVNPGEDGQAGLPVELNEGELARRKGLHRAVLAARLEAVWLACEPYVAAGSGAGSDVRMIELALKAVGYQMKLFEVLVADRADKAELPELTVASVRRAAVLAELEARRGFLEG